MGSKFLERLEKKIDKLGMKLDAFRKKLGIDDDDDDVYYAGYYDGLNHNEYGCSRTGMDNGFGDGKYMEFHDAEGHTYGRMAHSHSDAMAIKNEFDAMHHNGVSSTDLTGEFCSSSHHMTSNPGDFGHNHNGFGN